MKSLRDYLNPDIHEILVDDVETFKKMRDYMKTVQPRNVNMIKHYKEKTPLFDKFKLEEQINEVYQERVNLKSGGYIIISPTEAMITIDVNSGRASNKKDVEETAFRANLEAAEEIARQLRLRDLGGLIVIDFIDMKDKRHNSELEKAFKKALSFDRAQNPAVQDLEVRHNRTFEAEKAVHDPGDQLQDLLPLQGQRPHPFN